MPLEPGTTLGPYSVIAKIGEGGMGEVYRARDTKLDRDVALKVLPEAFTQDPDRLARFEREAKVLVLLSHVAHGQVGETFSAEVVGVTDGDTLVVETTHFNGRWSFQGTGRNMRLVERFTRRGTD